MLARFSGGVPSVSQAVRVRCARANAPVLRVRGCVLRPTARHARSHAQSWFSTEMSFTSGQIRPVARKPEPFLPTPRQGSFRRALLTILNVMMPSLYGSGVGVKGHMHRCVRLLSIVAEVLEVAVGMLVFQIDWKARLDCDRLWIASTNNPRSISWWSSSDDLANEA